MRFIILCVTRYIFLSPRVYAWSLAGSSSWYEEAMYGGTRVERRLLAARSYVHLGAGRANGAAQQMADERWVARVEQGHQIRPPISLL